MLISGIYLTVLVGPTIPAPAPPLLMDAIRSVEVTHDDYGRSGFQISVALGRSGQLAVMDYPLLTSKLLEPFNRVVLVVTLGAQPTVLMDGVITHLQLMPSNEPGASSLVVTGEDISVQMDLTEKQVEREGLSNTMIVQQIIASYAQYGLVPMVIPAPVGAQGSSEPAPFQEGTDLDYLQQLAEPYDYVFYVIPGPLPGQGRGYWGPRIRPGAVQSALSINQGPTTNVDNLSFRYNALAPVTVSGAVQDRNSNQILAVLAETLDELVLSQSPALLSQRKVRQTLLGPTSGSTYTDALARAQARVDAASNQTVSADGQLNTLRYGGVLEARRLVGVRGAGQGYDGTYYVKSVTHSLRLGSYTQSFSLLRQGTGSTTPVVPP
jgi:hypothetical protein